MTQLRNRSNSTIQLDGNPFSRAAMQVLGKQRRAVVRGKSLDAFFCLAADGWHCTGEFEPVSIAAALPDQPSFDFPSSPIAPSIETVY